jgi:glucose-6-phosphate 1-dehydrogenase
MRGDQTLFPPRADWILRAWQLVDPTWKSGPPRRADLPNYEAGAPHAGEDLLRRDRRRWHAGSSTSPQA